jgi:rhodanese-related sulfurtransferase
MFNNINTAQLMELVEKGQAKVIDCREEYEYEEGHIPGAILMPTSDFLSHINLINKTEHYYVICLTGGRSQMVAKYLEQQGYKVSNVVGGMISYRGQLEY